jgi:hypothetical protein
MSNFDRDPRRKVSEPTEADFARGIAEAATKHSGGANFVLALAASVMLGKRWARGKK